MKVVVPRASSVYGADAKFAESELEKFLIQFLYESLHCVCVVASATWSAIICIWSAHIFLNVHFVSEVPMSKRLIISSHHHHRQAAGQTERRAMCSTGRKAMMVRTSKTQT